MGHSRFQAGPHMALASLLLFVLLSVSLVAPSEIRAEKRDIGTRDRVFFTSRVIRLLPVSSLCLSVHVAMTLHLTEPRCYYASSSILVHQSSLVNTSVSHAARQISLVLAENNGVARTPPMGWNSWNHFACQTNCTADPLNCIRYTPLSSFLLTSFIHISSDTSPCRVLCRRKRVQTQREMERAEREQIRGSSERKRDEGEED